MTQQRSDMARRSSLVAAIESIARTAHEVNRAYDQSLGNTTQVPWDEAPEDQRSSIRTGVLAVISGSAGSPKEQHEAWMRQKQVEGWAHGPTRDPNAKTHPAMVAYEELPPEQRRKDHLFRAVVLALLEDV